MKTRKIKYKKGGTLKEMKENFKKNVNKMIDDLKIKSDTIYSRYLENVPIDQSIKMVLMQNAFKSPDFFIKLHENIREYLPTTTKKSWVDCINDCFDICSKYSNYEISTTAYILKALSASIIGDKSYQITFTVIEDKLTGYWENDQMYIKINSNNPTILHNGRLIVGFGPSSSGKTYCANKIIELMSSFDPSFPKMLLSIDGSIYRESSVVYQTILDEIKEKELYSGINNLVSATLFGKKSIFKTDNIKKIIKKYLKDQKKHGFISNLYVPETLGGCIRNINCKTKIADYIHITGDHNWIGLMIYQHPTPDKCPYHEAYKCEGTIPSGKSRELKEGKKYSSKTWNNSYINGITYIKHAPNYRFMIHNSGDSTRTSIFQDLSINKLAMSHHVIDFFKKNNWLYIDGDIQQYTKCHLFRNDCLKK